MRNQRKHSQENGPSVQISTHGRGTKGPMGTASKGLPWTHNIEEERCGCRPAHQCLQPPAEGCSPSENSGQVGKLYDTSIQFKFLFHLFFSDLEMFTNVMRAPEVTTMYSQNWLESKDYEFQFAKYHSIFREQVLSSHFKDYRELNFFKLVNRRNVIIFALVRREASDVHLMMPLVRQPSFAKFRILMVSSSIQEGTLCFIFFRLLKK